MPRQPVHEDVGQDEAGRLVGHVGRRPVLNALDDEHRVQPHEGSDEAEQGAVEATEARGGHSGPDSLPHAG